MYKLLLVRGDISVAVFLKIEFKNRLRELTYPKNL